MKKTTGIGYNAWLKGFDLAGTEHRYRDVRDKRIFAMAYEFGVLEGRRQILKQEKRKAKKR